VGGIEKLVSPHTLSKAYRPHPSEKKRKRKIGKEGKESPRREQGSSRCYESPLEKKKKKKEETRLPAV